MDAKRYIEVLIDGRVYTLGGYEDESYMQRVAGYINEMITTLKRQEGFTRQSADYQQVMIELNMADDYFKAREQIAKLDQQKRDMEKEVYSLKHDLVTSQMKLEAARQELAAWKANAGLAGAEAASAFAESGQEPSEVADENSADGQKQAETGKKPGNGRQTGRSRK